MRLAQLARKLSVKSSAIVDFLAEQTFVIEDSPNTKVDDEHVRIVLAHFAPQLLEAEVAAIAEESDEVLEEIKQEPVQEVMSTSPEEIPATIDTPLPAAEELPDIIRAPKIELSGLKVLGKIELPEKKKKEETEIITTTNEGAETSEVEPTLKPREKRLTDRKRADRPRRNPLAEAREREQREEEERRKAEEEKRKELRKQKYLQTRQAKAPVRSEKVKTEKEVKKTPSKKKKEESVSLFTRFMRWLTSNQS